MTWNCVCGVENSHMRSKCSACGLTREQNEKYNTGNPSPLRKNYFDAKASTSDNGITTNVEDTHISPSKKRPLSIAIASWFIIVCNILLLVIVSCEARSAYGAESTYLTIAGIEAIIMWIAGSYILMGSSLARWVYVTLGGLNLIFNMLIRINLGIFMAQFTAVQNNSKSRSRTR